MRKVHMMQGKPLSLTQKHARRKQTPEERDRRHRHHLRRGLMGLQFAVSSAPRSIDQSMRELARACYALGYDVSVGMMDVVDARAGGWGNTSVRHLIGRGRGPLCHVHWGGHVHWGACNEPDVPAGAASVRIDVPDSYHWAGAVGTTPGADLGHDYMADYNATADLLLVPTEAGAQQYRDAGLVPPCEVLPLGVDRNVFRPSPGDKAEWIDQAQWGDRTPGADCYLFLLAGYMQERKGMDIALDAYKRAFGDREDTALLVKTVTTAWGNPVGAEIAEMRGDAQIGYIEGVLSEWDFARLLASADCYLSPHRREGFGLIPLQALACGTRVVATRYDGPATYLTEANAVLVEPRGTYHPKVKDVPEADEWAQIDAGDFATAMRYAYDEPRLLRDIAASAGLRTAEAMSWEASAKRLCSAIERHVGPLRRRSVTAGPSVRDLVSVLVPCRNGQQDVDRLTISLRAEQWPGASVEVIILDDASDPPLTLNGQGAAGARIIRSEAWIGEMAARDWLLREAAGRYVFATDADVEFTPGWLTGFLKRARERGLCARTILHPVMLLPDGKVWSAGGCYKVYGDDVLPAWHRMMGAELDDAEIARIAEAPLAYAPGAGWFFDREAVLAVWEWTGGYFPTVFGDVDMAMWLRSHGFEFCLAPDVKLVHHHGSYTQRGTETAEQRARFLAHAREFIGQWGDRVVDDIMRGQHVE